MQNKTEFAFKSISMYWSAPAALICYSSTAVGDIDTSGIHALEELFRTLEKRKIQVRTAIILQLLVPIILLSLNSSPRRNSYSACHLQLILANPGPAVIQKLHSAKFTELIGEDKIFLTVGDAVKKFAPKAAVDCAWRRFRELCTFGSTYKLQLPFHKCQVKSNNL